MRYIWNEDVVHSIPFDNFVFCMTMLLLFLLATSECAVINLVSKATINTIWIEVGFANVTNQYWTTISTFQNSFVNPVIFLSSPDLSSTSNFPAIGRIRNVVKTGVVSFQTRIFVPNDTYCSKQWYIPQYMPTPKQVAWAVIEQGAYNVSSRTILISVGSLTRTVVGGNFYTTISIGHLLLFS